jgi:hypothetical protein
MQLERPRRIRGMTLRAALVTAAIVCGQAVANGDSGPDSSVRTGVEMVVDGVERSYLLFVPDSPFSAFASVAAAAFGSLPGNQRPAAGGLRLPGRPPGVALCRRERRTQLARPLG